MTGWRIGWLLVPRDLLRDVLDALAGNLAICPPAPAQYAALAAFDAYDECDGHVAPVRGQPRRCCSTGCAGSGIDRLAPADGAFYVYADISHLTDDSMAWCTGCSPTSASPSRRASTSIPSTATGSSGSRSQAPRATSRRPSVAWSGGWDRPAYAAPHAPPIG